MTTDRIHIRLHAANNRPRVSLIALTLVAAAFAVAPAPSLAAGEEEYVPSKAGGGSSGGGSDSGNFAVPGAPGGGAPAETTPAPVDPGTVPVTPTGPTPEEIAAAEAKAAEKALQKKLEEKAKLLKKKAKKKRAKADAAWAEVEALRATGGISTVPGTQTAADVARTAFEDEGAGPLPLVLGILLLVTGVGLVVRYRRTGRGSA